jgi:hypothetical protein
MTGAEKKPTRVDPRRLTVPHLTCTRQAQSTVSGYLAMAANAPIGPRSYLEPPERAAPQRGYVR